MTFFIKKNNKTLNETQSFQYDLHMIINLKISTLNCYRLYLVNSQVHQIHIQVAVSHPQGNNQNGPNGKDHLKIVFILNNHGQTER